jgi:hypothetical protein
MKPIRMSLLENAHDFVNESLEYATRAEGEPRQWKFAILNIVQAIELVLKERLRREHHLLMYENVDKPTRTVSLTGALKRIESASPIVLTARERRAIEKAQRWRDAIVHFEFELNVYTAKAGRSRMGAQGIEFDLSGSDP